VQLTNWLIDGLIRYEDLMDDWWDVDERSGVVRGQRTGRRIGIGDTATVRIVKVDPARRELNLAIINLHGRAGIELPPPRDAKSARNAKRGGETRRQRRPRSHRR
jgi:ribonuclease R